jgi:DnaJ family protein C protein 2
LYPAGPAYIASARRQLLGRTFEQDDEATLAHRQAHAEKVKKEQGEELYPGLGEEEEEQALLKRDAKEWKVSATSASRGAERRDEREESVSSRAKREESSPEQSEKKVSRAKREYGAERLFRAQRASSTSEARRTPERSENTIFPSRARIPLLHSSAS